MNQNTDTQDWVLMAAAVDSNVRLRFLHERIKTASAQAPTVSGEEEEEEEPKKTTPGRLGLLLGGLGLGGIAASQVVMNDATYANLSNLRNTSKWVDSARGNAFRGDPSLDLDERTLAEYADTGSALLNSRSFGMRGRDLIERLRKTPFLNKGEPWKGRESELHYDAFTQGPLHGYLQYTNEQAGNTGALKRPGSWGYDQEEFLQDLRKNVNKTVEEVSGRKKYLDKGDLFEQLAYHKDPLDPLVQKAVLERIIQDTSFGSSRAFRKKYEDVMSYMGERAQENLKLYYNGVGKPLLGVRNGLLFGGVAAAGAGLGMALPSLLDKVRDWREKKRLEKEQAESENTQLASA
jgi:hypothetical protein